MKLSIVIVNWNRYEEVAVALRRLATVRGIAFETIVVDNGSTDDSVERLACHDNILVLATGRNLGPAAARNIGIRHAAGRYILFLDSDATIDGASLRILITRMDEDDDIGAIGCRILHAKTGRLDQWIYAQPARTHEYREFETYAFSAAGVLVRADAARFVGGFWEDLFIYNEEVEFSLRLLRVGFRILYCPDAVVLHDPASNGRSSRYWYYQSRNWIWICYRHYTGVALARKVANCVAVSLLKGVFGGGVSQSLRGVLAGLRRTELIGAYPYKLAHHEVTAIDRLNPRRSIKLGR